MSRRKGIRPVLPKAEVIASVAVEPELHLRTMQQYTVVEDDFVVPVEPPLAIPPDWNLGALLNVRNGGETYVVTLYPEEADWRHPERALRIPASRVQDFVSRWYARIYRDPRA